MLVLSLPGIDIRSQSFPDMVFVEGAIFKMGDDQGSGDSDERPWRHVKLTDYSIAKTEITVFQWRAYCSSTNSAMPDSPVWGWIDHHPIVNISWKNATDYCEWLSAKTGKLYRLPTEAEWEFAARGGKLSKGFKYSGGNKADSVGFYKVNSPMQTQMVAKKSPNELGLYDMSGNTWEWCADWYDGTYPPSDEVIDPKGPITGS